MRFDIIVNTQIIINVFKKKKIKLKGAFLKKSITSKQIAKFLAKNKKITTFFLNRFLLQFLENFLKKKIYFNFKKCSNVLNIKQMGLRKFNLKFFKKNLKMSKRLLGILYYSLLLKDVTIFINFFKKVAESLNLKLHKKLFLGLRKLIKDFFKPMFVFLGVLGVFFNVCGKIGVSGSAKKKRYFFYFGKHSITTKTIKINHKQSYI